MTSPAKSTGTSKALLLAAEAEVAELGTGRVSLRGIARRAGVSHMAPGFLYGDRKGLFTALAVEGFEAFEALLRRLQEELPADADPEQKLQAVGGAYIRFAEERPGMFGVMMRPEIHNPEDPELQAQQQAAFRVLTDVLADAQTRGWASDHDPDALSMTCWAIVHGIVTLSRDGALGVMFPGVGGADAARIATRVICEAVRPAD